MTRSHEAIRDDLAAYALVVLDSAAVRAIEQHLAQCAECRWILVEYDEVLRLLAMGLPAAVPSPGARALLIERIRSRRGRRRAIAARAGGWVRRYRYPAVVVLCLLLLLRLRRHTSPHRRPSSLSAILRSHNRRRPRPSSRRVSALTCRSRRAS